jgi:glucose/arabinose dehydrogenase
MKYSAFVRLLVSASLLLAATPAVAQPVDPGLGLEPVVSGLGPITGVTHAGDGRLFVVEQTGRIRVVVDGQLLPQPFLDVSGMISSDGERGLLGLAFHPRYDETNWFFVNYTDPSGDTVIARFARSADPNVADPTSRRVLLTIPQPFSNHNGGQLAFGPDGYLYVALGDGGAAFDPPCNGQRLDTLLGKLLRLDVDNGSTTSPFHGIPADNPFAGVAGARGEIWAYGLRNPWRFSFDRATGDLYVGDVGQNVLEEVDFQEAASAGGENYGWKVMEASACTNDTGGCPIVPPVCRSPQLSEPAIVYDHNNGRCSVTGGYVYRGTAIDGFAGTYLFGDFCSGEVFLARRGGGGGFQVGTTGLDVPLLTTFGEDSAGELYVGNGFGDVYRLTGPSPPPPPPPPEPCVADANTLCLAEGRFRVRANFRVGQGPTRMAVAEPLTPDTGYFWFFNQDNVEVIVKVLDACDPFNRFWVFAGGLTNVEVEMRVYDSETGEERLYPNSFGTAFQPVQDTEAFSSCS